MTSGPGPTDLRSAAAPTPSPGAGQSRPGTPGDDPLPTQAKFPRSARLLHKTQFQRVFAGPDKSIDAYFTVLARPNPDRQVRLGLAIAKKCARRAVDRNRLKRLIRESFRSHRGEFAGSGSVEDNLPGFDLVVLCRRDAPGADNPDLLASLARHWARIRKKLCASSSSD